LVVTIRLGEHEYQQGSTGNHYKIRSSTGAPTPQPSIFAA